MIRTNDFEKIDISNIQPPNTFIIALYHVIKSPEIKHNAMLEKFDPRHNRSFVTKRM